MRRSLPQERLLPCRQQNKKMSENNSKASVRGKLSWTVGFSVALGVPLLIIPSIEYFAAYAAAFSIFIWGISVLEGFVQNMAYGEMAVDFPDASGLPGFAEKILGGSDSGVQKIIGGFCAWGYCLAWIPIPSIFTITIVDLLTGIFPALETVPRLALILVIGAAVLVLMFLMNRKGLSGHAGLQYALNIISLVPLIVLALYPLVTGQGSLSNITQHMFPDSFRLDAKTIFLMLGLFGMAEWSACAWETAAIYGPEYRDPGKDTPKALISCGLVCLAMYLLIQTSCVAVLGVDTLSTTKRPAMLLLAEQSFGKAGGIIAAFVLIIAMFTIIQTGFAGSSRAMKSMSDANTLPPVFGKVNRYGMPQNAMLFIMAINVVFFLLQDSSTIVAASSMGYSIANGLCLLAYVKHKITKKQESGSSAGFAMPRFWFIPAAVFAFINLPLFFFGLIYLMNLDYGLPTVCLALVVLALFFPLYAWNQARLRRQR